MSEKMYAHLLRLLPREFRRRYEEEALLLVRDRLRDERGFASRLRLILDLITDIVGALPQAYRNTYTEIATVTSITPQFDEVPSFRVLQQEPIRRGAIATAGVLSFTALVTLIFVMAHPIPYHPAAPNSPVSPIESVIERLNQPISPNSTENPRSDVPRPASATTSQSDTRTLFRTKPELSSDNKIPASAFNQPTQSRELKTAASALNQAADSSGPNSAATAVNQPAQSSNPKSAASALNQPTLSKPPSARYANERSSVTGATPSSPAQSRSSIRVTRNTTSSDVQALSPATVARNTSERWTNSFRAVGRDIDVPQWFVLKRDGVSLTGTGGPTPTEQYPIIHGQVTGGTVTFELQEEKRRYLYNLRFEDENLSGILSTRRTGGMRSTEVRLVCIR